jgi:hypothetical protein
MDERMIMCGELERAEAELVLFYLSELSRHSAAGREKQDT